MISLCANWVEPLQVALFLFGSWCLAFGIINTVKMSTGGKKESVISTEKSRMKTVGGLDWLDTN